MNAHSSTGHNSQRVKATQSPPSDEWVSELWAIHPSITDKKGVLIHATYMNLENIRPSKEVRHQRPALSDFTCKESPEQANRERGSRPVVAEC